jgi:hypothetical protein
MTNQAKYEFVPNADGITIVKYMGQDYGAHQNGAARAQLNGATGRAESGMFFLSK